jgi:hypothetical protein
MTDADNLRSGLEVSLLRVERDRGDALAGIVERCLSHLATMGSEDSATEVALIEARGCLASALRRDEGRPLAVLVTEVRDIFDACRAALGMEPTEWATEIVAQIECFKSARKREAAECREAISLVRADAARAKALYEEETSELLAEIAALSPGPWRTPDEEPPPRGEWIAVIVADGFGYTVQLSETQPIDWMKRWRRLPVDLLKPPAMP